MSSKLLQTSLQLTIKWVVSTCHEYQTILTYWQPLALTDNPAFQNTLITMRLKSMTSDLPATYDMKVFLHNTFVKHMMKVKEEIMVSTSQNGWNILNTYLSRKLQEKYVTVDGWSADTTKMGFLGMTAHWIQVLEGKWKLNAAVIGFKALHSSENLGRHMVGLLNHVGIMDKTGLKGVIWFVPHSKADH